MSNQKIAFIVTLVILGLLSAHFIIHAFEVLERAVKWIIWSIITIVGLIIVVYIAIIVAYIFAILSQLKLRRNRNEDPFFTTA